MLDWTDRHCRYFLRLLSRHTLLYTEMVTTGAIIHGKGDYLAYSEEEHPVALQLGGSDPQALAQCAKLAEARGYDEINLNVGCPSDRVQNGMFGACLMGNAPLVSWRIWHGGTGYKPGLSRKRIPWRSNSALISALICSSACCLRVFAGSDLYKSPT